MRLPVLAALLAACTSTRPYLGDVDAAFREETAQLALHVPTAADLAPARAAGAPDVMRETERRARAFLDDRSSTETRRNYVRALLACAHLAQGKTAEARADLGAIKRRKGDLLSDENVVITAALHAVGAARAMDARAALVAVFERRLPTKEFVAAYGSFVGSSLPAPDARDYALILNRHALEIETTCFAGATLPEDEAARNRTELHRLVAEQFYNDAAALLVVLDEEPRPGTAPVERWLATVAVRSFVVLGQIVGELLPLRLTDEQKRWQLEQIQPTYERARAVAARFLEPDARKELDAAPLPVRGERDTRRALYARLREAEVAVIAWIETR